MYDGRVAVIKTKRGVGVRKIFDIFEGVRKMFIAFSWVMKIF